LRREKERWNRFEEGGKGRRQWRRWFPCAFATCDVVGRVEEISGDVGSEEEVRK
jgi:hypothetical protein